MNESATVEFPLHTGPPPLRVDEGNVIRVGKSRVTLDLLVEQYENGMTPEAMVRAYDTLALPEVYAAIGYYLDHIEDVRAYLKRRQTEAAALRSQVEGERSALSRAELVQRRGTLEPGHAAPVSDADVHGDVLRGLRRHRADLDLVRVQDELPEGTPDPEILAWAASANRVLITNHRNTMVGFARRRLASGNAMPGLIVTTNEQSIGGAIEDILLVAVCVSEEEVRSQAIIFLPL